MKKLLLLGILAMPMLAASAEAKPASKGAAKAKVNWRPTFAAALSEAKRTGKPIFVDFYTTWCAPCAYLENVSYKHPKFVAESRNWVMVKLNAEKGAANIALTRKYKIDGYFPSLLFLKPNGKESTRRRGSLPPEALTALVKKARQKADGGQSI